MINDELIIENGYKEFNVPTYNEFADKFFQKKIQDENGIKYFISIYRYPQLDGGSPFDYEFQLQCNIFTKNNFCNIKIFGLFDDFDIKQIESKIEELWKTCGGIYYE